MSYFKKLYLGESVKTSGKASFKSLRESEPTPEIITFYFYNGSSTREFTAYEGMTWEEWIDSDFNSEGKFGGSENLFYISVDTYYVTSNGVKVKVRSYIQAGVTYRIGAKLPGGSSAA